MNPKTGKLEGMKTRKERRTKENKKELSRLAKIEKLLEADSNSEPLQNSYKRTALQVQTKVMSNAMQDAEDVIHMDELSKAESYKAGDKETKKLPYGGFASAYKSIVGFLNTQKDINDLKVDLSDPRFGQTGDYSSTRKVDNNNVKYDNKSYGDVEVNPDMNKPGILGDAESFGDNLGAAGIGLSTLGPLLTTVIDRVTDKPNINAFAEFGRDGLETNYQAQQEVKGTSNNIMELLDRKANTQKDLNRRSARSANTMRNLDLATFDTTQGKVKDTLRGESSNLINLLNQQAGLENQQDSVVMQGEAQRDIADRQDKGAFATNMSQDLNNLGTGVQQVAANYNEKLYQDDVIDLIPQLNRNGIGVDKKTMSIIQLLMGS